MDYDSDFLKISIMAGITNMILDFLFIYVFKWGVFGAAFAIALSQTVGEIVSTSLVNMLYNMQLMKFAGATVL